MFKKPASVAFKGETRLKKTDAKRLQEAVSDKLGGDESAAALLPPKADVIVKKVGGGITASFIFADGGCILVQLDGRANVGEGELLPALQALWRAPLGKAGAATALLPCVLIQRPVAKFIFGGANIMAPGIHSVQPADDSDALPAVGALVAVSAVGNPSACAVGRLLMPASSLGRVGTKGEAVEVLHYFGDCLWEACGKARPEGFVGDQIRALVSEDDGPADGVAAAAALEGPAGDAPADGEEDGGEDAAPAAQGPTPEEMTLALEECLLQALKTRIKDKDLPLTGNVLYTQHMRPCRRAGSNIDVKTSSCKKLVTFMNRAEETGWIGLKRNSPEPVVTRIFRDHPDVRDWKPWPRDATAEAEEGDAGGSKGGGAQATIEVDMVWKVTKLKALAEALGPDAIPPDQCWTRDDLIEALQLYADEKELWQKNNRKRVGPDGLLLGLLGEASAEAAGSASGGFSLETLADKILKPLPVCHRVATPQGGAAGGMKRTVRAGKPPMVEVRTDQRRGHSVTLVHGLEAYGVDSEALAAILQKALASNSSVEEATAQQRAGIMVQGFWDVAVVDWLAKCGIPPESIQHQAKKGQQQKKAKQGSNIVRA